tara:strand:- start:1 stop:1416 length:1416 start_codon:yes stop_codon:yes gene_type:complete
MRVQFSQSIDFNQMLVFSVFLHLVLLTFSLFLPKPSLEAKPVVPAFMVNVVEIPSGVKSPIKRKPAKNKLPITKNETSIKKIRKNMVLKKQSIPKKNKIITALKDLDKKATALAPLPAKKMLEELDQLAKLEHPKKLVAKPKKKRTDLKQTFRELNKLKDKKIEIAKKTVRKPVIKNLLEDFDDLKMEEVVDQKEVEKKQSVTENLVQGVDDFKKAKVVERKETKKQQPVTKNLLEDFDDLKMEELVEQKKTEKQPDSIKENVDKEKTSVVEKRNLLDELESLAKLDLADKNDEKELGANAVVKDKINKVYGSALKKLGSISVASSKVEVEIDDAKLDESKLQSKLGALPDTPKKKEVPSDDTKIIDSRREGTPSVDAQSLYAGLIREKIYKNWRDPLAEQYRKEAIISFRIFPKGNIDKPFVTQSTGVGALDTLAVRAVLDSVPFPKFPKELKKSNLLLNIYFKYVPKDQ